MLLANLGLAALCMWLGGPDVRNMVPRVIGVIMLAYIVPLSAVGLTYISSLTIKRKAPTKPWRWFWRFWVAVALFCVLISLLERFSERSI